jgi:iron(III) transport system ATP-binding protein
VVAPLRRKGREALSLAALLSTIMRMDAHAMAGASAAAAAAGNAPALLQIRGLSKRYGRSLVVDAVDLDIGEREFVCLLGPSGCGKTTLLRMLCGIEPVSTGQVLLHGRDITHVPPAARGFGVVFQSYALFPNLTALENVAYGLRGLDRAHRRARAEEMLELVGLAGYAERFPAQLSGGQQQRVALARALAPNPGLLLLDEPLSALDAQVRQTLRAEIRRIQRTLRIPVVMVTHDQDEALSMADRIVLMEAGRVNQQATPADLYVRPANSFAARFIGRINLWPVTLLTATQAQCGEARLQLADGGERPAGSRALLGIRPEHVELLPWDPARARCPSPEPLPPNHWTGRIESVTFCGPHLAVRVGVAELGLQLDVECPTPADGRCSWQNGALCTVHLPAAALRVLPA